MRLFLISTFIVCLSNLIVAQTCILVVRTQSDILIGTDSKAAFDSAGRSIGSKTVCKIRKVKNIYATVAGPAILDQIAAVVKFCSQKHSNFEQIAALFDTVETLKLQESFEIIRRKDSVVYRKEYKHFQLTCVTLCGFDHNIPKVYQYSFWIMSAPNEQVRIKDAIAKFTKPLNNTLMDIVRSGHFNYIDSVLKNDRNYWSGKTDVQNVENLINLECEKEPQTVGKPIEVLHIYKDGYKWELNPMPCTL